MSLGNYNVNGRSENAPLYPSIIEAKFTAAAAGTEHVIIPAHRGAYGRVYAITGDGTIDMTAARAAALVAGYDANEALSTDRTNLKTGLMTYFTNIAAEADAAECYAFAINLGGDARKVKSVEWEWVSRAAAGTSNVARCELVIAPIIVNDVALNSSNALLRDDGSTAIAVTNVTDQLVIYPNEGLVFGAFTAPDGGGNAMASGDILTIRCKL